MKGEVALRRWLNDRQRTNLFWVEPAGGSTIGLPDAFWINGKGGTVWLELKVGALVGRRGKVDQLRWTVRPAQRATMLRLALGGVHTFFLVHWKLAVGHHMQSLILAEGDALNGEVAFGPWPSLEPGKRTGWSHRLNVQRYEGDELLREAFGGLEMA